MRIIPASIIGLIFGIGCALYTIGMERHGEYDSVYVYTTMSTGMIMVVIALVGLAVIVAINNAIKRMPGRIDTTNAKSVTEETRIIDSEGNTKEIKGTITF